MNLIAGNWKMNKTSDEAKAFVAELIPLIRKAKCEVALCVPFTCIDGVSKAIKGSKIKLGAQNIAWADHGAFTGEVSGAMLAEFGVEYVIVGHSERRQMFGETNETVNKRLKAAFKSGLKPILCVGESNETRMAGITREFIGGQLRNALEDIPAEDVLKLTIAYEPIWAIGTGLTATPEQAESTAKSIRRTLTGLYDSKISAKIRILYGGSMNAGNASALLAQNNIKGGLIGGASLKAADFASIINYDKN